MEMYGNIRCITFLELVSEGKILSKPSYDKYVREKKLTILQRACRNRIALIEYNSLPERIKAAYNERFPNALLQLKEQQMSNKIVSDSKALDFYKRYTQPNGSGLTDKLQAEYKLNAEVFNEMRRVESNTKALHNKSGFSKPKLVWEIVWGTCENLRREYGHTLPKNQLRLRQKFNEYKKNGYVALISGKVGNKNTRKILGEEARFLLKLKRSRVPVYTDEQIYEEFNRQAPAKGWKELKSINSVRNYLYDPAVMPMWYAAVFGELEWKKKYSSLQKTDLPTMRDSLWYSDGTKLNLYYRNSAGKMCTTSVYEVMDAYSEVFLGYDIAPGERFDSQYRAFRMAVRTSGCKPYELVYDNQGGHKKLTNAGFLKKIARVPRPTMPYNGQSKTIESAFGRFQAQILHKIWHFTGLNITTNKANSRPNLEFIETNASKLPTLEEVKAIYAQCRKEWNEGEHPKTGISRMDMYKMSENPQTEPVTELDMIEMFWLKSKEPVTYTNYGLKLTVNRKEYHYDVYGADGLRDEQFAFRNTGRKLYVMYDPEDMTLVELWRDTGAGMVWEGQATPKVSVARGVQERTTEETVRIRQQLEKNKESRAMFHFKMEDFDFEEGIHPKQYGLIQPVPKGISKADMDHYRKKYERSKHDAGIKAISEKEVETLVLEEPETIEPQTIGQYVKQTSNITHDESRYFDKM